MKKRLLFSIAAGVTAALALTIPAYALPAEAVPSITPSLTYMDGPERVPTNPGPFPIHATEKDLEEFETPENEETSSIPETSEPSEPPELPDTPGNTENEGSEPLEPGEEPGTPNNSEAGGEPDNPESPAPETPIEPENPEIPNVPDETLSADVSAIRESLGIYIESQRPFFADDTEKQYFFDNLAAIRKDLDILLHVVIPISAAVLIIYKFCIWFYRTFVESALE